MRYIIKRISNRAGINKEIHPHQISIALKLIPPYIIDEHRAQAEEISKNGKPKNWFVGLLFILTWIALAAWIGKIILGFFK